jgi:CxxC motif-containing protein (DUF1111 family)
VRRRALVVVLLTACGDNLAGDERQGGDITVDDRTATAFTHPAPGLSPDDLANHENGRGPFDFVWEAPQLGPLLNNDQCFGCHGGNGRGLSQIGPELPTSQALVRCSLTGGPPDVPGGPASIPGYGTQLQDHATQGLLPEVVVNLSWLEHVEMLDDGTAVGLRAPITDIRTPSGGFLPQGSLFSYRQAPGAFGLGLLDAVDDATILALADPDDADGDGISGRPNMVWDAETSATEVGRFGHKCSAPNIRMQTAGAFANDMGLSNKIFPDPGNQRDVSDDQYEQTVFFVKTLAVPAAGSRGATALLGRDRFSDFGCVSCHVSTLVTGDSPIALLAHQTIHPYTDLLLHDMGDGLSDGRPDFAALDTEWRTAPLWGLGLVQIVSPQATFLHDGRARTLEEAIMWHGGEAASAKEAYRTAAKSDRDALIAFLNTL